MVDNLSKVIAGLRQAIFLLPLFCLACLIFPSSSFGQQLLELDDQKGRYPLGLYIDYLEDRKGELKIEELKSAEYADRFIHSREEKPNFGINPSVYWARFTLRNKTNYDQDWLLEVDFPLFGSVTLYTPQDGSYRVLQGGLFAPFNKREVAYRNDVYRLRMLSGEEKTFFLRIDNKGTKSLPLILWKPESFIETVSKEQLLMGLFYGIYIVMILYNLYLFAVLRDKNYLLYVCYVLVNGLFHFTYTGLSFQYLWPNSVILTSSMMFAFVGLSITFGSLFARGVLMLRSLVPTMDKAVLGVSFSGLLILLTGLLDNPVAPVITAVCGLVNPPIVIISSYTVLRKGYTPARFYLISWLPVVVSLALTSFLNFGFIPINFITRYSLQISSTFTVILFSMALADRINVINRQRLEAEEEALRQQNLRNKELELHNKELEQKVAERTNELVTSIKKLEIANQEAERKNVELIESHQRADRIFSALAEALPGTVLDGKYKLEDRIGGGGFGAVFRAKQLALGRTVAVKVFKPTPGNDSADAVERFKMEGVSASRLSHPNAVTVIDSAISQEGIAYLVMEYLSGRSLTQELRIEKKLSVKRAAEIIIPVCNALSEAHRLGIIHRDIKPDNVFISVTKEGEIVKVVDFGIAKMLGQSSTDMQNLTASGAIIGTPKYIAPERLGGSSYDGKSDIYSVGVMFYEMICGRAPFRSDSSNAVAIFLAHLQSIPPSPKTFSPEIPEEIEQLLMKMLAKDPSERPTAAELSAELTRFVSECTGSERKTVPAETVLESNNTSKFQPVTSTNLSPDTVCEETATLIKKLNSEESKE